MKGAIYYVAIFACEDNMLFSHVKISSFRAKAHLVFHWCLYNKLSYFPLLVKHSNIVIVCSVVDLMNKQLQADLDF